ncbi:MAG: 1-acyl-sn-glycerol-3-phosphate acyltransferase [Clostridia bacterium]|nr:1-acyl-sn-glycerol-3-phosphate acyltransferase [Clostridia bacterium]
MKRFLMKLHVGFMCAILRIFNLFYRVRREAMPGASKRLPKKSGTLVIANHTGLKDPVLTVCVLRSLKMRFLVAENAMDKKVTGPLLRSVGCMRIDRNICDLQAIKKCVKALCDGFALTVFPEGGIQTDQAIGTFKTGMILMAMQANVPIVPVYLAPGIRLWHRQRAMIGKPFYVKDFSKGKFATMAEMNEMAKALHDYEQQMQQALEETRRH